MSDARGAERPRQVTVAAWLIMLGSAFVVVSVFEQVAGLHTLEAREAAERIVSEPPGSGLGLDVDSVLMLMRVLATAAAACATATGVLGFYVLRRSRNARLALTVLAVPLFLTGMVVGGFMSSVVAAATLMLWLQPTRDWVDGVTRSSPATGSPGGAPERASGGASGGSGGVWPPPPPTPPVEDRPATGTPDQPATGTPAGSPPSSEPRAYTGYGVAGPTNGPSTATQQAGWPSSTYQRPADRPRPAAVLWACLLTWVVGTLAVVVLVASMVALAVDGDALLDQVYEQSPELAAQGISRSTITALTLVLIGAALVWALAALVLAGFVWRGASWARIVLIVSASAAAGMFLFATVASGVFLVPLLAAVTTSYLLMRTEARAWFASRGSVRP